MSTEELRRRTQKLAPAWEIVLLTEEGEQDLTARFADRLISLRITDKPGVEADDFELVLDDSDEALAVPPTGALLSVAIGWEGEGLVDKGQFTVDELDYGDAPSRLTIRGRGAAVGGKLSHKKTRSWHEVTLGDIGKTIAEEHGLALALSPELAEVQFEHVDQTEESDTNFLTRLAKDLDAIATVKERHLLITPAGTGKSAGGTALPAVTIRREDIVPGSVRWTTADRTRYTGVEAAWHDTEAAERKTVLAGTADAVKTLRKTYADEASAQAAAEAELRRLLRGEAKLSLTLSTGNPTIGPETPASVEGLKDVISAVPWLVGETSHSIDGSGYRTKVSLEIESLGR